MDVTLVAEFPQGSPTRPAGYIAHPFWVETHKLIQIQKGSGMNRAKSAEKVQAALKQYLAANGLTMAEYESLLALSKRQFHTRNGHIVIPAHHVYGMLVHAANVATSSIRIARPEQIRSLVTTSDWETPKTQADGVWERFAPVFSGGGAKLSNERGYRANEYITGFEAQGVLSFSPDTLREDRVKDFLIFAGREVGIGASRKMGWGRFALKEWSPGVPV